MENTEQLRETIAGMRREIDSLRTENQHAQLLLSALDAVLCTSSDGDLFAGVFQAVVPVFECTSAMVLLEQDKAGAALHCVAASCAELMHHVWPIGPLLHKVLAGRTISSAAHALLDGWPQGLPCALEAAQPALYLPLLIQGRRGLMVLVRDSGANGFDRGHVALARKFSVLGSHVLATQRASLKEAENHRLKELQDKLHTSREALHFRANHDPLTGLPNRAHVQELVTTLIARKPPGAKLALAFINLDDFKRVNDLHGHAAGDALLREVTARVQSQIRQADVFGRINGDEFVIALDPVGQSSDVAQVIQRIRTRLQQPLALHGTQILPSASIGVALYPTHGADYETLRRHADLAMNRAKALGKGSVAFFTPQLGQEARERLTLEQRLRDAVAAGEFCCALQRKVDIRSGAITGFEALARWVDAQGNMRLPGQFLPLASELQLLDDIALQLVADLVRHLPRLDAMFGSDVRYSVNVSPAQAVDAAFMARLTQGLPAGQAQRFIFEITEESLADTGPLEALVLPMLRRAGVRISIDDFGTGYSSLAKLAALTVDELKIDRSLIQTIHQRPRNQLVLRAIESLGTALGLAIVAEGIETEQEREFLLNNTAITVGQGFLFHKPQLIATLVDDGLAALGQSPSRLQAL
ncbi:MAG: EAL domain-containing protein [Proteobacteria bacterium]|nr:EAL domain-containing protein [Pseudomonadota bacterium]